MLGCSKVIDLEVSLCGIPIERNKALTLEITLFVIGVLSIVSASLLLVSQPVLIGAIGNGVILASGIVEILGALAFFVVCHCRKPAQIQKTEISPVDVENPPSKVID